MSRYRLWPRSLRWRLQLWQGFLLLSLMAGFGVTIFELQSVNRFRRIDEELETRVTALSKTVRDVYRDNPGRPHPGGARFEPPDGHRPPRHGPPPDDHHRPPPDFLRPPPDRPPAAISISPETSALFGPAAGGYYYVIWFRNGTVLKQSENAPANIPPASRSERDTLPHFRTRGANREAVHCSGFGDCSLAGRSIGNDLSASRAYGWTIFAAGLAVLGVGLGMGWWLIGRAIRPVELIRSASARIAQGNLSERIEIADADDELGRLATVLNSTFARLESAFVRQQQFTADAAHELRTPLAILISEAQTTLARERTAAEYRETIEGSLETAQQLRKLTEMLLELARFDSGNGAVSREQVNLADLMARSIERLRPLAAQRGITIQSDLALALAVALPERLEVVAANLLMNAIHYNRPRGSVRVSTYTEDTMAVLKVEDTGVGIAQEDLTHIFDRFYRADKSRSRSDGHAGLGLAICKTIVDAERGSIEVSSTPQSGSTFTVRIPT